MKHSVLQQCHTKGNILRNTLFRNLLNMLRNDWLRNMYTLPKNTLQNILFSNSIRSHPAYPAWRCATIAPPHLQLFVATNNDHHRRTQPITHSPHHHLHPSRFCTVPPPPFQCSITSKTLRLCQSLYKG